MKDSDVIEIFFDALSMSHPFDEGLRNISKLDEIKVLSKKKSPQKFNRDVLFTNMNMEEISLFYDYPSPFFDDIKINQSNVVNYLSNDKSESTFSIKGALGGIPRSRTLHEIMQLWKNTDQSVHITDLHIDRTDLNNLIAPRGLSDNNLFKLAQLPCSQLEMLTFIITSKGRVTFAHTDDADSINYSMAGSKLWLTWETDEGIKHGLQDIERQNLSCQPNFSVKEFLNLKSANWFIVEPGLTLHLPGKYTHMVIALEDYIGISNFNFCLANAISTLDRWFKNEPLFSKRNSSEYAYKVMEQMMELTQKKMLELSDGSTSEKKRWGYNQDKVKSSLPVGYSNSWIQSATVYDQYLKLNSLIQ